MKLFVRAFTLSLFVAGASAALVSSHASNVVKATPSHVAGVSAFPIPGNCNCPGK